MIIAEVVQGTPEWEKARLGIPTSSGFDKIITTKGEPSKTRLKYMYQLAAERITGIKEDTYKNGHMARGQELEGQARAFYELTNGVEVKEVGVCYLDDKKLYACSPDGLVGEDGLVEIKCPSSPVHIGYFLEGVLPLEYLQQVQGQLFVTGRKWCDFFSFYPNLRSLQIRVKPDQKFIENLKVELGKFCIELDQITEKLRSEK